MPCQTAGLGDDVVIQKQEVGAGCAFNTAVESCHLSLMLLGDNLEIIKPAISFEHFNRRVVRPIVDDDDLEAATRVGLLAQPIEAKGKGLGTIVSGDDNA